MTLDLRFRGPVSGLTPADWSALRGRTGATPPGVPEQTAAILTAVRQDGDAALRDMARRFDGVSLVRLEVPRTEWRDALDRVDPAVREALRRAARNIEAVHLAFRPRPLQVESEPGVVVGRRPDPFRRAGIYAPGGRAAYPSSVLMGAIPARVAGVEEVILLSPPGPDGRPADVVLAAAEVAGVDRVFAVGGAGAIGALTFGTEAIPAVDCIVGPGNAWVAEAKLQVSGRVVIDGPAGPSELVLLADDTPDPAALAAEMVAQAEHDPGACVVAVVCSTGLAARLEAVLGARVAALDTRREIVREALAAAGGILTAESVGAATEFAGAYAPEHLLLAVSDPSAVLPGVRNAGTVFLGTRTSVAFGDYLTGANHVLPTGGAARRYSGLSTDTFVRWTTWQEATPEAVRRLARDTAVLARAEGLGGHAVAALTAGGAA